MQAVILAGGAGTRLRPLTSEIPKAMVPVRGKPLLERILENLTRAGANDVKIVVGYKRQAIQDYFGPEFLGARIEYLIQEEQKGTGHALRIAKGYVSGSFLAVNSDVLASAHDYKRVFGGLGEADAVILARETQEPWKYGVLRTKGETVWDIIEKPVRGEEPGRLVSAGVYGLKEDLFGSLVETKTSKRGEIELADVLKNYIKRGKKVKYLLASTTVIDVSDSKDLEKANTVGDEAFPH